MNSPVQRLAEALEAWRRREAQERVARWRRADDALPAGYSTREREHLVGPRIRELFEESAERGLLESDELGALVRGIREAILWPARAIAERLVWEAFAEPVPYDSNHHRGGELLRRITVHDHARKRRAMARSLLPTFEAVSRARREGRARVEEALESAAWLHTFEARALESEATPDSSAVDGLAVLDSTDEAWREILERLSHAARVPAEHWTDLVRALRQSRWDDSVPRRSRPRRLAQHLGAFGLESVLRRHARLEPSTGQVRSRLLVVQARKDVRISPGRELGVASERDGIAALGHAAALLLAHPALPVHLARQEPASVPETIGALLAHLLGDPIFSSQAQSSLSAGERRTVRELALGLELFELRTAAASCVCAAHVGQKDFRDAAHAQLERAWTVELSSELAAVVCEDASAPSRLRATQLAAPLAVRLRDHFDEDFWRNPRCAEPIRHAASRGSTLSPEAWAEELGVHKGAVGARMTELLS